MSSTTSGLAPTEHGIAKTLADADMTLAAVCEGAPAAATARTNSRTVTVLPRVETEGGTVRLVHAARERYETERLLGEGGMGTVDLARDHDIDRHVAIKRLRREVAGSTGVARFVEEVRTVARLEHPNIVPVHDVGLDDQGYFLVMKYVDGESLERIIERLDAGEAEAHRRYTFEVRVQIFIGLLRALAYAHDRGIIHRDIKPANVMVGPYGEVVLMDWGIARPIEGEELPAADGAADESVDEAATKKRLVRTQGAALVGTPMYMSPEQARGQRDLDARTDLYSACVLFHELLTLHHYLADKQSVPAMLLGVMDDAPPGGSMKLITDKHPHQSAPPLEYLYFVRRGMAKDRGARWQSAQEMMETLEAALEGKVHVQCAVTMSKRMTRECGRFIDRHPRITGAAVFGTAIGLVAGVSAAIIALVA